MSTIIPALPGFDAGYPLWHEGKILKIDWLPVIGWRINADPKNPDDDIPTPITFAGEELAEAMRVLSGSWEYYEVGGRQAAGEADLIAQLERSSAEHDAHYCVEVGLAQARGEL